MRLSRSTETRLLGDVHDDPRLDPGWRRCEGVLRTRPRSIHARPRLLSSDAVPVQQPKWQQRERKKANVVVVRSYSEQGASALFDLLGQREEDVKILISGVPGFVSYAAFRSGNGGMTVTICQDKAGTDESSRRAAEWVKENVTTTVDPPTITEGSTVLQF
jgi:hypothetical protein